MTTEKQWWVGEYAQDIHNYLRQRERKRFLFRGHSPQLHMRKSMVQWMDSVCDQFEFCVTVQHLAVYLLDIFMDNHTVSREHLHMVTIGCLLVAVKLEEQDCLVPRNSDLNKLLENKYKLAEFVQLEISVLTFFNWDVLFPTAAHFAEYYVLYALRPTDTHDNKPLSSYELVLVYVRKYIDYFLEVTIQDHKFLDHSPSLVAASCIASTRMCLVLTPPWPVLLQNATYYKYAQLKPCVDMLLRALDSDMLTSRKSSERNLSSGSRCSKSSPPEPADYMISSS